MNTEKLAVVSKAGLSIISVSNKKCEIYMKDESKIFAAMFDTNGTYLCYCNTTGTYLLNMASNEKKELSLTKKFRKISFSPLGNCISLFLSNNTDNLEDNVWCYKTSDCSLMASFKCANEGDWAPQWSADEKLFIRFQKSELYVYTSDDMSKYSSKVICKGLETAAISMREDKYHVAISVKNGKEMASTVKIYEYPNLTQPINNRSIFKANVVSLHWSPSGKALLILVHSKNTKTKYYGEDSLYFMRAELNSDSAAVEMPKREHSIHSVYWKPLSGDKFIVTYGDARNPTVYNDQCKLLYQIDAPNRNVCKFNHCGEGFVMMGTGTVQCSMQLWNVLTNKIFGEMNVADANRVYWSGDDQYIVSATVSPAIKDNNGLIVWHVEGEVVADQSTCSRMIGEPSEVYSVFWQPHPLLVTPNHTHCSRGGYFLFDSDCKKVNKTCANPTLSDIPKTTATLITQVTPNTVTKKEPGVIITNNDPVPSAAKAKKKKKAKGNK